MMRLHRIGQIAISVKDLDKMTAYYQHVLGLAFQFRVPAMAFFEDIHGNTLALLREMR
jgi:catechol 2,3-dioxygenase-like lactoylglutathione lyase family enzyme